MNIASRGGDLGVHSSAWMTPLSATACAAGADTWAAVVLAAAAADTATAAVASSIRHLPKHDSRPARPALQLRDPQLQPPAPLQLSLQLSPQHRVLGILASITIRSPGDRITLIL